MSGQRYDFTVDADNPSHLCDRPDCSNIVSYDDEPYCFKHSPDSGSYVPGYSFSKKYVNPTE